MCFIFCDLIKPGESGVGTIETTQLLYDIVSWKNIDTGFSVSEKSCVLDILDHSVGLIPLDQVILYYIPISIIRLA